MRIILLFILSSFNFLYLKAQSKPLSNLPSGTYQTNIKKKGTWEKGNIIILNDKNYKVSISEEVGEFRFSVAAQRIFFTSGPLKHYFARTYLTDDEPVIFLPISENEHLGLKLSNEVWCYYQH